MSKFRWVKTQVLYSITLSKAQFLQITRKDDKVLATQPTLRARLQKMEAVCDVEYDGWYGPHIFIRIFKADDTKETHAEIERRITDFLQEEP